MDTTTIRTSLSNGISSAVAFVSPHVTTIYNNPIVGIVAKIWERTGPTRYLAPAPAIASALLGCHLLNREVSNLPVLLLARSAGLTLLVASGFFTAAFAATAFSLTGGTLVASGVALPAIALIASRV